MRSDDPGKPMTGPRDGDAMTDTELDRLLHGASSPVADDALQARMLDDFDAIQKARRDGDLLSAIGRSFGLGEGPIRRLVPAGALGALGALGFAVGVASANDAMISIATDETIEYVAATFDDPVEQVLMDEEGVWDVE